MTEARFRQGVLDAADGIRVETRRDAASPGHGTVVWPFHAVTGARLILAVLPLAVIALAQDSFGELGAGFSSQPGRLVLLALIPGLLGLLLYYRGLSTTRASHATLAELAFPATAVALNWIPLGVGVTGGQMVGFFVLWAAIYGLARIGLKERHQNDETEGTG